MKHSGDLDRKVDEIHRHAINSVVIDLSPGGCRGLDDLTKKCESPIERLLLEAICLTFWHREICSLGAMIGDSVYHARLPVAGDENRVGETSFIDAQVEIAGYRADLVVARWEHDGPDQWLKTPLFVIECDGHEFHERTKEQAQRDKLRDREIEQAGHPVLRFTGSEIWLDAWSCAQQVNGILDAEIIRQYKAR